MKLPNAANAFVDLAKLRDYSLSRIHEEGQHKARVFFAALGLEAGDAVWLKEQLLRAAITEECQLGRRSELASATKSIAPCDAKGAPHEFAVDGSFEREKHSLVS
jgi:hypothetical protein